MHDILKHIANNGVVAILRGVNPTILVPLSKALSEAGVGAIEVTLNSESALEGITALRSALGDVLPIGAGTVLTAENADAAIKAGATFVLTPCLAEEALAVCCQKKVPAVIGVMTPSEAVRAYSLGCEMVKIFPASSLGPKYFKELQGPLPQLVTMAVGGVNKDNAAEFIKAGAQSVGAGGQLVDFDAAARGDWEAVKRKANEIVTAVRLAKK